MTTANTTAQTNGGSSVSIPIHLTADAELMKYDLASRAVDVEHRIRVVQDKNGNPMIFSIGTPDFTHNNQSAFYVIMRQAGTPTGWQQIDLSSALGNAISAVAFEVSQVAQGQVTIALAVETPDVPGMSQLYVTAPLTLDPATTDWKNFHSHWIPRPTSTYPGLRITKILLGGSAIEGGPPLMIVATTQQGGNAAHYTVDADTRNTDPALLWKLFPLPNNTDSFIDLAIGRLLLGRGVYALYQVGPNLTLEFTTFKDKFGHGPYNISLVPPPGTKTLFPLPNAHGYTDLYVAGDHGISLFPAWEQPSGSNAHVVVDAQIFPEAQGLTELIASADASKTAIWAIGGQEKLLYTTGDTGNQPHWSHPVILRSQVAQIAPLRNQEKQTNEIFLVGGDNSLAYLWQDPVTTLWKESDIPLPDTGKVLTLNSYATHIHLADQNDQPLIDKTVNITASEWVYVTINGFSYELDPVNPVPITPDIQGNITIIHRVTTISTPIFHLQADFLGHVIDVDPAAKIKLGLKQIKSGNDLKNARTHDGAPLLQGNYDDQKLDHCSSAIQQISTLMDTLPQGNPSPNTNVAITGPHLSLRTDSAASSHTINAAALPSNYLWGVQTNAGAVTYMEGNAVQTHILARYNTTTGNSAVSLSSIGDEIRAIGGDILETLERRLEEAAGYFFVLQEDKTLALFIDLGKRLVQFTIKVVSQALSALNVILKDLLGIDLEKWLNWLGLLFNWNDIVVTHRVFVNLTNQMVSYVQARLPDVEKAISNTFDQLKVLVSRLEPITGDPANMRLKSASTSAISGLSSELQEAFKFLTNSPGGNYGCYQLLHGGVGAFSILASNPVSDALLAFLNDIALPALASVSQTAEQLFNDLEEALQGDNLTPALVFQKLGVDATLGVLDIIKTVTIGLLKFIGDLTADVLSVLNSEIRIPIISVLYEKFVGSKMSLLDGLLLLFAIPATIGYKVVAEKAPFADTTYDMDTRDAHSLLSGLNLPPHPFSLHVGTTPQEPHIKTSQNTLAHPAKHTAPTAQTPSHFHTDAQQGSDQPPSSQSNQASPCATAYSQAAAFLEILIGGARNALGLVLAAVWLNAKTANDNPPSPGPFDKYIPSVPTLIWTQFALSLGSIAVTFPVKSGPELTPQLIRWGFSFAEPIVLYMAARFEEQEVARKVIGQFEVAQAFLNLVLTLVILGIQVADEGNDQKTTDGLAFCAELCNIIGLGSSGIANLINEQKEFQWVPVAVAGFAFGFGALFDLLVFMLAVTNKQAIG